MNQYVENNTYLTIEDFQWMMKAYATLNQNLCFFFSAMRCDNSDIRSSWSAASLPEDCSLKERKQPIISSETTQDPVCKAENGIFWSGVNGVPTMQCLLLYRTTAGLCEERISFIKICVKKKADVSTDSVCTKCI